MTLVALRERQRRGQVANGGGWPQLPGFSAVDLMAFRQAYARKLGADLTRQRQIVASAAYKEGDPEAVTARYRLHFKLP